MIEGGWGANDHGDGLMTWGALYSLILFTQFTQSTYF
jgi:hypothetical protein